MKKGVLLIISCLIIAMTMLIAFFGVLPENVVPNVPITSVSISAMDGTSINVNSKTGVKQQKMEFVATGTYALEDETTTNSMEYIYNTALLPDNSTKRDYLYSVDLNDSFVKLTNAKAGAFIFLEPDYVKEGQDEIYHIVEISCKANDGGPGNVSDKVLLVLHYVNKEVVA
jgi:hypothetical protein